MSRQLRYMGKSSKSLSAKMLFVLIPVKGMGNEITPWLYYTPLKLTELFHASVCHYHKLDQSHGKRI